MYDIGILGGGSGGYVAAIRAARLGAKVVLIEKDTVGGTCLNRGCIPTKAMLASTGVLSKIKRSSEFGINVDGYQIDFGKIMERKDAVVKQLTGGVSSLLDFHKVTVIKGDGKLTSTTEITVSKADGSVEKVEAKNIIIATGSESATIAALGYNGKTVVTSKEILELKEMPSSLLIVGAGVIGCEFAMVYAELGIPATMVEAESRILPMIDEEVSKRFALLLKKKKIGIQTGVMVEKVTDGSNGVDVSLNNGKTLNAGMVLIGIGRTLNSKGIGLEDVGVEVGPRGEVVTDEYLQTSVPNIYGIGDVNNKVLLAHAASAQGNQVVENIINGTKEIPDIVDVPSCIYTSPEIASIGLTEKEAAEKGPIKVGKFPFSACGKALCIGEKDGFVKIITDANKDKIVGAHILGPHATDLIAELVLAVRKGLTAEDIAKTIHAHPTISESIMEAAEAVHGLATHTL